MKTWLCLPKRFPPGLQWLQAGDQLETLKCNYKKKRQVLMLHHGNKSYIALNFCIVRVRIFLSFFHPDTNHRDWHKPRTCVTGGFSSKGDEFTVMHPHFLPKLFIRFVWPWNRVKLADLPRNGNYNLYQLCPTVQSSGLTRQGTLE